MPVALELDFVAVYCLVDPFAEQNCAAIAVWSGPDAEWVTGVNRGDRLRRLGHKRNNRQNLSELYPPGRVSTRYQAVIGCAARQICSNDKSLICRHSGGCKPESSSFNKPGVNCLIGLDLRFWIPAKCTPE